MSRRTISVVVASLCLCGGAVGPTLAFAGVAPNQCNVCHPPPPPCPNCHTAPGG
jgi:hypothetical protein